MKLQHFDELAEEFKNSRESQFRRFIVRVLRSLIEQGEQVVTKEQFDAALGQVGTALTSLSDQLTQAVADINAKIAAAGSGAAPQDFTDEMNALTGISSQIAGIGTAVTAADPGPAIAQATAPAPTPTSGN